MKDISVMTLKRFMQENTSDLRTSVSISLELADMLRKLHQRGVIRHNLNPEYVSIDSQSGRLTLLPPKPSQSTDVDERIIKPQDDLIQAFAYISPEQTGRMKRKIDSRSDLYGFGILMYELLTGELPFKANTANEWIHAHMALLPVPPRTKKSEVPPILNDLILKLLSKPAENRYQSAYGLQSDLQKCLDQQTAEGIIEPFPLGEADERSRFQLPDKLYGRENELSELLQAYERSRSGSKELILIGGHTGSGKTTLIKAIQSPVIPNKEGYCISGKFDQFKQTVPYTALILAFRDLIRQILAENDEQIAEWKKKLVEALGQSGVIITDVISELTLIMGEQPQVEDLPPLESTNRFQSLFSNLIKVFADKKHPLVISLDDLQWADPASLQLLQVWIQDPSIKHLLILGAYRNNEIHKGHILEEMLLGSLRDKSCNAYCITIEALDYLNVIQYIADVLNVEPSKIKPLAEIIYQKTAGNPFYMKQILQFIYDEKLLYFNSDTAGWDWSSPSIMELKGFKDVISLIVGRFNALPDGTRQVMRLAGCIGSSFDIRMLSLLYEQEIEDTEQDLLPALNEGLVLVEQNTYMFLHDRVQKAAYDLIPDEEKKQTHLKIGRLMLRFFDSEATDEHLFEVVHHLNLGSELITDLTEIVQLARLNLRAGKKAKTSAAYVRALELLKKGVQLIEADGWSRHYQLYFKLLLESSECEYFCGYFVQAESILEHLLLHVYNPIDRAKIYIVQVTMFAYGKREREAADIALKAMAEFGLNVRTKTSHLKIIAELANTQLRLTAKRSLLMNLPMNDNPMHQALADIVMASSSILFVVNEELSVILFAKYVRMSLKQGHSEAFSIALGSYAVTLALGLKTYRTALRLAEAAISYSEKTDSILLQGKIQLMMALILQYVRPQEVSCYFQKAGQLSMEGGDMVYAGYAISCQLITGSKNLQLLSDLCKTYSEKTVQAWDEITLRVLHLTKQYIQNLQNTDDFNQMTFNGGNLDEGRFLLEETESNQHKGNLYYYYTCKLEVYYLYGRFSEVVTLAEQSEKLYASMLLAIKMRHCFYHALAIMAVYSDAPDSSRRSHRKVFNKLLTQMKQWTKAVPESALSKYSLMLAELSRLEQDHSKAAKLYDQAIQSAQENDDSRDEAIANELAASYYLSQNKNKAAEAFLQNACKAYFKWGALGKVKSLQERHPMLRRLTFVEEDVPEDVFVSAEKEIAAAGRGLAKELDVDTLRQASKIIPNDKAEADLLESFLDLAILNAGAEKGFVLLGKEGSLAVEAEKDSNRAQEKSTDNGDSYSAAIVQFVMRTREPVVLGEARQSIFASESYIRRKKPRSILCLPIHYPDNRIGVLYLENNLTSDAFTADRLEILEMIFSRMAYLKLLQSHHNPEEAAPIVKVKLSPALVESLTDREMEILRLMAEGLTNKEIGLRLVITEGTVKNHGFNLFGKLQVKNRIQAVSKARELQLLDL